MQSDRLTVLELTGTARARGRAQGEALRGHIRAVNEAHEAFLCEYFGVDPRGYLAGFRAWADFGAAIERWAPELLEEVRGIAEGAAVDFEAMLGHQLIDEEWAYGFYRARPVIARQKCTAFAATATAGTSYAGQNMDVPRYLDGHQVLLHIRAQDSTLEQYVFTYAGLIGLAGMNAAPLGITCNTLNQLEPSPRGLPVAFLVRRVLGCTSVESAAKLLREVPHASGQNYILSEPHAALCLECSASKVVGFSGEGPPGRLCHTNHALVNDDQAGFRALLESLPPQERELFTNSKCRYESVAQRLGRNQRPVSLADVKAALSAHDDERHPVSRTYTDTQGSYIGFTAGSLIYEYGTVPRLYLAAGPPCSTSYRTFDFAPSAADGRSS